MIANIYRQNVDNIDKDDDNPKKGKKKLYRSHSVTQGASVLAWMTLKQF